MADTAKIVAEVLTTILPDITARVIRQLESQKASATTTPNVRPLMECDVREWHTMARHEPTRRRQPGGRREYGEARPDQRTTQVWTSRDHRRHHPIDASLEHRTHYYRDRREVPQYDRRSVRRDEGRRHAPIPPGDFARIREDVYLVVRRVQMAHHVDLWATSNPARALTDGVRRLVENIKPPRANDRIRNRLREEGEKFLGVVQATVLQHLKDGVDETEELLQQQEPPAEGDSDEIHKQAEQLLRKNYGHKLTPTDINIHLEKACTVLCAGKERRRPHDTRTRTAALPHEDGDDEAVASGATTTGVLPVNSTSAHIRHRPSTRATPNRSTVDALYAHLGVRHATEEQQRIVQHKVGYWLSKPIRLLQSSCLILHAGSQYPTSHIVYFSYFSHFTLYIFYIFTCSWLCKQINATWRLLQTNLLTTIALGRLSIYLLLTPSGESIYNHG